MSHPPIPKVRAGFLNPYDRFSELVFGLVMTLSVTGSMAVATHGADTHEFLWAAIGCNVAWGLVDAVMYLLTALLERKRNKLLVDAMKVATPEEGLKIQADALPAPFIAVLTPEESDNLRKKLVDGRFPASMGLVRDDFLASLGVFLWVVVGTLPVSLPFAFIRELNVAMRVSNGIAIVLLFVLGFMAGRYSGLGPWRAGGTMLALGLALVAAVMALGG